VGVAEREPPFRVGRNIVAEKDPLDGLDFRRQMLILKPKSDRPIAHADCRREFLGTPFAACAIFCAASPSAPQQVPAEQLTETPPNSLRVAKV